MREFLKVATFALALAAFTVLLSVALWNEGCNQVSTSRPIRFTDTVKDVHIQDQKESPALDFLLPNDRILVVPAQ